MEKIIKLITEMRQSRGWDKTDTLPLLIKSVAVEAAELLETIQWDEQNIDLSSVKAELADVLMYSLSIAIDQHWDVEQIIQEKMEYVYMRYPKVDD